MRFAFFGYDYSIDIAQNLMAHGHELMSLFTFPCDQMFSYNLQTYALADMMNIPITDSRATEGHIAALIAQGCEVFLVAGYPRKIPPIDETKAYGINIHPALLPRARGIMPVPYILLREPEAAGFTIHKLSEEYDSGDILYQEAIEVNSQTDVEILSSRVALRSAVMAVDIFDKIQDYWTKAIKQDNSKASSYPAITEDLRSLDWNASTETLNLLGRAFGRFGVIATIVNNAGEKQKLGIFQFSAWKERHTFPVGTLMRAAPREVVVATADGFALLKDFQVIE